MQSLAILHVQRDRPPYSKKGSSKNHNKIKRIPDATLKIISYLLVQT